MNLGPTRLTPGRRGFTVALADFIWRWRIPLSIFLVVGAVILAPRANVTTIDNDITAWFSKEDQVYKDYERFRQEFAGTRTLIVALQADSPERLFSRETLQFIEQVTGDIERVETVQRVDSLASATVVEALPGEDGGLDVRPLIEDAATQSPGQVRRRALDDDILRGDLVSESGTVTAIVVGFDEDRIDAVRAGVIQQIHDIVDPKLPPGVRAHYNGSLEISETYNRITIDNQVKFTPPILLFTIVAIYAAFRSWRKTMLAMFAILMSILWTLGLYSLMGFNYNVLSSMLVPLVVVLAIADDVHIMQRWGEARRQGIEETEQVFKRTVAHLTTPLFGASVTTALGMLSLATSNVVAVRSFGIGSAVGIMVDFVISIVLVPTLLTFVKFSADEQAPPHEKYFLEPLRRVARLSCAHPARVLTISLLIGAAAASGISRLRVDTNHINFFAGSHPLGESARVIDQELSGVYSFQLMLEGPPDSLNTPDALQRMDRLQNQLRQFAHVRKVTSVADYVKRINKELNDGREEANVIPDDAATIAQELFVFALGGEGRHELARVVASDYSRAQINVKLQSMSSELVLRHVEDADRLAKEAFAGTGISVLTTGSGRLFSTLDQYLVDSQLSSFGTAFLTVFAVIFIVFRSWRFGALTIVPNLLPVIAVLGVMGYLDISMNIATVMVASVALGVVDDDTIHFINRYRREVAGGATTDEAIEQATIHEGRASLTTAIINSVGYAVLFLSEYKPTAWFGGLLALTMAVAFLAEVFILPPIIKLMPRVFGADALRRLRPAGAAAAAIALAVVANPSSAAAQEVFPRPTGTVSVTGAWFPSEPRTTPQDAGPGFMLGAEVGPTFRSGGTGEVRARLFGEQRIVPSEQVSFTFSAFAEGLLGRSDAAIARVHEATTTIRVGRFDLYAGYGRVVWGRLDELQPTDVINPLEISRFFFEGRSEARLPVALARARWYFTDDVSLEAVYVPFFRRGRFDQLDEGTSPFNVVPPFIVADVTCQAIGCPPLTVPVVPGAPSARWSNAQGGARFNATTGTVDWSLSAYHGFQAFGVYEVYAGMPVPPFTGLPLVQERFPRFTMAGGDFETVRGQWGIRGEVAAFLRDGFQPDAGPVVEGSAVDGGVGVDRRAGNYRFGGTVMFHVERADEEPRYTPRKDLSLIVSADRTFAQERYQVRAFSVYNPLEGSSFVRTILTAKVRDEIAFEASGGWFAGDGRDTVGRFGDSDFVYGRLKYYW